MMYGQEGGYGSVPKKKRTGLVIVIILFVVILAFCGLVCYKMFFSKNSIQILLDSTFYYLESSIGNSDYDSLTGNFLVSMKFNSADTETNQIFGIFNKLDFSGNYGIDYDKNVISLDLSSNYDDKDLIDMSIYTEYGRGYVYLDGLYDKYIDSSIDNYSEIFERKTEDSKNVIVGLRKAIDGSLKDEYFVVEKVTVDSEKLTKTTLDLTGDNYKEFSNSFKQMLLDNKSFLESYANITDDDVEDVKEYFGDFFDEYDDYEGEEYVLYTKGVNFVKFEAGDDTSRLVIENNDNAYEYELYEDGVVLYSGIVEVTLKKNRSIVLFSFYDNEEEVGVELTIDVSEEINGKVAAKDVTNSISTEKISYDDIISIYNKLMKNEGVKKIIEEVSDLMFFDYGDSMITG